MERIKTSLSIDKQLWKSVKIDCAKKDLDISDWLENAIRKMLKDKHEDKNI